MHFRLLATAALLLLSACATFPRTASDARQNVHDASISSTPLLLVSIDGLRPTDITAAQMPVLHALGEAGVRAEGMRPSYPSLTFPNHYAIVTGLRPDHHGIIHNDMHDARLGTFSVSKHIGVDDGRWWGGEPIWSSAEKAGLRTAAHVWPGSEADIGGTHPQQRVLYRKGTRADDSAATVADWFAAAPAQRPRFVALYFDQVDEASHNHGPDSAQAIAARGEVDAAIGHLLQHLHAQLGDAVNVVVVSDHGFATVPAGQWMRTTDMVPADVADAVSDGEVIEFAPKPDKTDDAERALLGRHDHYECWRKGELPPRWHYGSNPRIPAIVCQMDLGWDALRPDKFAKRDPATTRGSHGYDPDLPAMFASFLADGPAFQHGVVLPTFDNVDVYLLLAHLLDVAPEPNDGDIAPLLPALHATTE